MDRLAACHLMHGFLHVPNGRRRHPTAPSCQHVKAAQRSLSLADRRGVVSPAWTSRCGLISPMPHHAGAHHYDNELDGDRVKRIHNMSLVMEIVDFSHLNTLSTGTPPRTDGLSTATLSTTEMAAMPMHAAASFSRQTTTTVLPWNRHHNNYNWQQRRPAAGLKAGSIASRRRQSVAPKNSESRDEAGELMLSLCYFPQLNKLVATIVRARDLPGRSKFLNADPYVKMRLVQKRRGIEKRKTAVSPQTQEPVYNESFAFGNLPCRETLRYDVNLVVTVMDYDVDEIGHVIVGMLGGKSGYRHWNDMLDSADVPITLWHRLTAKW